MFAQRLRSFKPAFFLLDCFLSFLATLATTFFYFYILVPHKRSQVSPDSSGWFAPAELFPEEWGFFVTYGYVAILISLSQVVIFSRLGLYQMQHCFYPIREFMLIMRGVMLNLVVVLAMLFFYRGTSFSRYVFLLLPIMTIVCIFPGHRILWQLIETFYQRSIRLHKVILIGTGKAAKEVFASIERHRNFGYRVVAVLGQKSKGTLHISSKTKDNFTSLHKGSLSFLPQAIKRYKPSLIIYATNYNSLVLERTIRLCDEEGIEFNIVPDLVELISSQSYIESLDSLPLLVFHKTPLHDGYNQFFKRIFDIFFASLVLVIAFPLFVLLSLLLFVDSGRPIFFRQERVGLNQRSFWVWKFRTMITQDQKSSDTLWSKVADKRVTGVGSFLRQTSLDELPQFWNVLTGDMSIVGPRPERPFFVEKFKSHYKQYMRRHVVKSGITGWAQVQGLRGDTSISQRVSADIYYIENWSLWLDIIIVMKTLPAIIKNPGH